MANRLNTTMPNTETQDKLALVGSKSTVREISEGQNEQGSCGKNGITIYCQDKEEDRGFAPLDRAARNELIRQNPQLIAATIAQTQREKANQQGYYQYEDYTVVWDASFLPFHLGFSVICPGGSCHHLVSVRNRFLQEPAKYAEAIIPLAKSFIEQPLESSLPHLPFVRPETQIGPPPRPQVEEEKIRRTIEQARLIVSKHGTLLEMDIQTAEATAKLVNAGKIDSNLLSFMTDGSTDTKPLPITCETEKCATRKKKKTQIQGLVQPSQAVANDQKLPSSAQQQYKENKPILNEGYKDEKAPEQAKEVISIEETVPSIAESLEVHQPKKKKKAKKKSQQKSAARDKVRQSEELASKEAEMLLEISFPGASKDSKLPTTPLNTPLKSRQSGELASKEAKLLLEISFPGASKDSKLPTTPPNTPLKSRQPGELASKEAEVLLEPSFPEASKDSELPTTPPNSPLKAPLLEPTLLMKTVSDEMIIDEENWTADHATLIEPYDADRPNEQLAITDMHSTSCLSSSLSPSDNYLEAIFVCPSTANRNARVPQTTLAEGRPQLKVRTSFDDTTCQPQQAREITPISESLSQDSGYSSPIPDLKPADSRLVQGLKWTYATRTEADADLLQAGVWLWNEPRGYLQPYRVFDRDTYHSTTLPPVFISHQSTGDAQPMIEYDGTRIHIVPHATPWPDLRATPGHPDFLVPCKLVEYQASEAAGYLVSRHNRSFLYCRKTGCDTQVVDDNSSSYICPGCGPKTVVRYCSFQHLAEDVKEHWEECGHPALAINSVIDHVAERSNSYREFPAIKEKHGIRSAALQLQQVFARYNKGHYTLIYPCSVKTRTLSWPEADPKAKEMNERIERLLNIAFLDTTDYHILSYLYRILRHLLITAGEWDYNTQTALNTQFSMEFADGSFNTLTFSSQPPCECEWIGQRLQQTESHLAVCSLMPSNGFGVTFPVLGLRAYVKRLENRYWILRASRQQHPTEAFWQRRAAGYGFPGVSTGLKTFTLGPGWTGWGGKEDDICLPDKSG